MNMKVVAVILLIVSLGLAYGWYHRHTQATGEIRSNLATINKLSNSVAEVTTKFEEQQAVNMSLERDLQNRTTELKTYSNNLARVTSTLAQTQSDAKASEEASKAEILRKEGEIAKLEAERDGLSKTMTELNSSIGNLEGKIAETQRRLEDSEEDREFLLVELKRLQTEKAELERQFNDMALLREQVRRLRDEMSISRRLDWIRRGLYGSFRKGGELLQQGFSAKPADTNYNLNVELGVDGSVKLTQPSTNAAPSDPVPADQ
ncbi:MAG: hypothetical protein K9N62_11980 [Verrucomicrobia bacterium]|nr:hypothetical protein [Verrucomicrobiota bacterium]